MSEFFINTLKLIFVFSFLFLIFLCNPQQGIASDFTATTIGDYGNITVMEVEGNYDARLSDGKLNDEPRQIISKEFFRLHKNDYDFLVIFTNFDFQMPEAEAEAFYHPVKNDIKGIGIEIFDNSGLYGSNGRLQGIIDMGNINRKTLNPFEPGFEETLSTLSHELLHRWAAHVRFMDDDGSVSIALLGKDASHWSYLLDTDGSVLYGNYWQDNGDGTFTSVATRENYSPLDLYLMGFVDKTQVPPMLLIDNPSIDPARPPEKGVTITGQPRYITIDDIITVEGERVPDASNSQKSFNMAFILLTQPDTFRGNEVYKLEDLRDEWITRFSVLTDGEGFVEVSSTLKEELPENPGITPPDSNPRTLPPDIEDGVRWLIRHQEMDGRWVAIEQTVDRDTAEAVLALRNFEMARESYLKGMQWLENAGSGNMDYLVRKIIALTEAGRDVRALIDEVLSRQNSDGGWGSNRTYMSNPVDTSFALLSLAVSRYGDDGIISKAIDYLRTNQNTDGGWGSSDEESTVQATSNVLMAFNKYRENYQLDSPIERGIVWLLEHQNPDGGFGNSPSTVYDTALAVLALRELNVSTEITNRGLNYILSNQSGSGSWYESPYQTALAISAVWKATIDPDLAIQAENITFSPSAVTRLPEDVVISAVIWNLGRTDVPQARVVLYEGVVSEENKVAEQVLAFAGQSSVTVTFPVTIKDGNEHRYYIVVDPEGLIKESNEQNNTALKILYPEPTYDFEILPSGITVSSDTIDMFDDVIITSTITNKGTMNAYNVQLKYYIDEPGGPFDIATVTVDIPAGETIRNEYIWRANRAGEKLPLTVQVDPFDSFAERSEDNNTAVTFLTVNDATEPDLTVSYQDIVITPAPAYEGGSVNISALVKNKGFSTASDIKVTFYKGVPGEGGVLLGSRMIASLNPGESSTVSVDWKNIMDSGERIIYVQVDPDNLISEIREDDNDAFVTLRVLSLPDLAISKNSVVFTPSMPKDGDIVTITVTVKNQGEQDASGVTVRVYEGSTVIGSEIIPVISANSHGVASFTYDTTGRSGVHEITVTVDPDNTIAEISENNNQASRRLGVQDANLWLTEHYISPNGDGVKDSTEFFFRLETPETVEIWVVNEDGERVRTFSGGEFENTTGGNITWDGLDDDGRIVSDGQYQIQVVDQKDNLYGSLVVIVDNNSSPLTDAIGTEYLLNNNLTCMLPDINNNNWDWLPDESGIVFSIPYTNSKVPEYPAGVYTMAPDGEDIQRLIPGDWTDENPYAQYSGFESYLSPDGMKVLVSFLKKEGNDWGDELWMVDTYGEHLRFVLSSRGIFDVVWAPDSRNFAIREFGGLYGLLSITNSETLKKTLIESGDVYVYSPRWSPDGKRLAYIAGYYDQDWNYIEEIRITDLSGNKDVVPLTGWYEDIQWLGNDYIISIERDRYEYSNVVMWLIKLNENGNRVKITEKIEEYKVSPDRNRFVFIEVDNGTIYVKQLDSRGMVSVLYNVPDRSFSIGGEFFERNVRDLLWSHDSRKIGFVNIAYKTYEAIEGCPPLYVPYLIVVNALTMEKKAFKIGEAGCYSYDCAYSGKPECYIFPDEFFNGLESFFKDNTHIIAVNFKGYFVVNTETGEIEGYLPIETGLSRLSPVGRYITYYKSVDSSSVCYGRGYRDLWTMSSLLNLTADLRVKKDRSSVILKGTAADLNFEGYKLEYADVKAPNTWNLVKPPSDMPVVNDVFATWVPPYEGTFYVRLTVWDRAGNVVQDRRRVSWGLFSSITNLYKTEEVFSPNGDGVKDTVDLHYRVLEPVHLEFYIYDEDDNLIRTFTKDYTAPEEDYITWDGRDEYGKVVPDGVYKIKVFDYEFFVEVDNTPPDVGISLKDLRQDTNINSNTFLFIYTQLEGHSVDDNLKSWIIEYGEGDNPEQWFKLKEGNDLLVSRNENGQPNLSPIGDVVINRYFKNADENQIEWLVGKKFRITAEDYAGNKSTFLSSFLEEDVIINEWWYPPKMTYFGLKPLIRAEAIQPGPHVVGGLETIRLPLVSMTLQYWNGSEWFDITSVMNPASGTIRLEWDNPTLNQKVLAARVKVVDIGGNEHYSNIVYFEDAFLIDTCYLIARNSLYEALKILKFQIRSDQDIRYAKWTDYRVIDNSIPVGVFDLTLPDIKPNMTYYLKMIGIGVSGKLYESDSVKYPPVPYDCKGLVEIKFTLSVGYNEADCGLLSNGKTTLTAEGNFEGEVSFKTLSYFIETSGDFQLLRQFDLTRERWDSIVVDTSNMPEGRYPVKAVLTYIDLTDNTINEVTASNTLIVDRSLPAAEITYPKKSLMICPVRQSTGNKQWYGIPVEGVATDNQGVRRYELYYGVGKEPLLWNPAMTVNRKGEQVPIVRYGAKNGQLGLWDVTGLKGQEFSLRLKVVDVSGNVSCSETSFSIDTAAEITYLGTDRSVFSPNGDGIMDEVKVTYRIDEYANVDVQVYRLNRRPDGSYALGSSPVRTIVSGLQHLGGTGDIAWDGRDDAGAVVPDGEYGIVVSVADFCGNTKQEWVAVEVDNTPPDVVIYYPQPGQAIGNIVEVRGTASDRNFNTFTLEAGEGDTPDTWRVITSGRRPVKDEIMGIWNTSGLDGTWTLRLRASDRVGNQSETTVTVNLGVREDLIKDLRVEPSLFSPNSDGRLDSTNIIYELTDGAEILIEVLDSIGSIKHSYKTTVTSAGVYSYRWDGLDEQGTLVPDGAYRVRLRATLISNTSVIQEEKVTVVVDTTPPTIDIKSPEDNSYISGRDVYVTGTISDENLLEYSIEYEGAAGTEMLDTGQQSRQDHIFGILNDLSEGRYTLEIKAKDKGENLSQKTIAFTIDRTPPEVLLETPGDGEIYGGDRYSIDISGSIKEKNIETYLLRYGQGGNPSQWTELLKGSTLPQGSLSYTLQAGRDAGIPDGIYTISLYAKDRAGFESESKVTVTVDNTPPEVIITSPKEGDYVKEAIDVTGTVRDMNLDKYKVEISEGNCSEAYKWAVLGTSDVSVQDGVLTRWQALPSDGNYCLRVTATDKPGQQSGTRVDVVVDTHPPLPPELSGELENRTDARLTWTANTEPDLAGYNLYREGQKVNTSLLKDISYLDQGLDEGTYTYTVTAVDLAGWESKPSNAVRLRVDLTGPDARIRSPKDGGKVSEIVDIKGTAYSSEDFREYRVYIGKGLEPTTWELIRRSPVPISYGTLAKWDTIGVAEEVYTIRLEADDINGNTTTHQIAVTIDNTPPAAPVLISAVADGSDITVEWKANTEPDLAGYLLYRNDQIANVSGIVVGNLRPYLIAGTTYLDKALPDGKFRYYLVAMDEAGNLSEQSNPIEVTIDTHPPHMTIVDPEDGDRFEQTIMVKAKSPDLDISEVRFEYKRASESLWSSLGDAVTVGPYITYLDPDALGLSYGDYHLRAVATDEAGNADPSPEIITITYTDLTAPTAPEDLKARTIGGDVTLTWTANTEPDLAGYNIYRSEGDKKIRINATVIKETTYQDRGLSDGKYSYEVTAVDAYGNESEPSNTVRARVYAPVVEQPYTPTGQGIIRIQGSNAEPDATVEIFVDTGSGPVSQGTAPSDKEGNFAFNLTLALGENQITAKARDNAGNVSRQSETVVVVYNEPPAAPTGLTSTVQDYDVALTWVPNTEADLSGYNLYREGEKVNLPLEVRSGNVTASSFNPNSPPSYAFDSKNYTYWASPYGSGTFSPVWWEIQLPDPELINHIEIHWGSEADEVLYAGKDYEIQVWSGHAWITQIKVTGNNEKDNLFDFVPSYRTDRIRIYITDTTDPNYSKQVRISEVIILKDDLITQTSYEDMNLGDGQYSYEVTAVDYYGFESPPSDGIDTVVGDVVAPSAPINLTATASGADIILNWTANTEPDLAGYNIYRKTSIGEWRKINPAIVQDTTYIDAGLPNGTYTYRITALDSTGNESEPSKEASATVYNEPPQPPLNLTVTSPPEGGSLVATWQYSGTAAGYNLYRSIQSGGPYTKVNSVPIQQTTYTDRGLTNGQAYYYVVVAVDAYGNESVHSNEAMGLPRDTIAPSAPVLYYPTIGGKTIRLYRDNTDIAGRAEPGATVELFRNGVPVGSTITAEEDLIYEYALDGITYDLSPDGKRVAYTSSDSIYLMNLETGATEQIVQGGYSPLWSPDGNRISYLYYDDNWSIRIGIYDIPTGETRPLTDDRFVFEISPSWSADGRMIAFVSNREDSRENVWIKDIETGSVQRVSDANRASDPRISPDGNRVAYFEGPILYLVDLLDGDTREVDAQADGISLAWSPDSKRLAFASYRNGNADIFVMDTESGQQTGIAVSVDDEILPQWSPDGSEIVFVRQSGEGSSVSLWTVEVPGQEELVEDSINIAGYLSWTASGGIGYADRDTLYILYRKGYFRFEDTGLEPGQNLFHAIASDSSGNTGPPSEEISVVFDTALYPDLESTEDDVYIYPPYPITGDRAEINVVVWNRGGVDANNVGVDLYLWDSRRNLEMIKTESIPYIPAGSAALVTAEWDSTDKIGENKVIVVLDPEDRIREASETNNYTIKEFYVASGEGVFLETTIDATEYRSMQDMRIDLLVRNSGPEVEGTVRTWIEDAEGYEVALINEESLTLSYASEKQYSMLWNTGSTYAGPYRVHTVVLNGMDIIAEDIVTFSIVPDIDIDTLLTTDRVSYGPGEDVSIAVELKNKGRNYIIPEATIRIRILDSNNRELFSEDNKITSLLPGTATDINSVWNTGLSMPGDYRAVAETYLGGEMISQSSTTFRIEPRVLITGKIISVPSVVRQGGLLEIGYNLYNSGNIDAKGVSTRVLIVDSVSQHIVDTKEELIDLPMNTVRQGKSTLSTAGYAFRKYNVVLQVLYQNETMRLDTASFTVMDGTPPVVNIISPGAGSYYNSRFDIVVTAADDASGVDRVEYRIDGGGWKTLPLADPLTGRYSTGWVPEKSDEGTHTIYFQATDRDGNTSVPVSTTITIDLTPPEPPEIISPPDESFVSSEIVDIKGVAELGAVVEMGFGEVVTTMADPDTGEFYFKDVSLLPGKNIFLFNARDRAGNVSDPTRYVLYLGKLDVTKTISRRPRTLVWLPCERQKHHDEPDEDERPSGEDNETYHDRHKRHGCHEHRKDDSIITATRDFIEQALNATGAIYEMVSEEEDFLREFRSGLYNTYVIVDLHGCKGRHDEDENERGYHRSRGDHHGHLHLHPELQAELSEAVFRGEGLILIKTSPSELPELREALGVKFRGRLRGREEKINFLDTEISDEKPLGFNGISTRVYVTTGVIAGSYEKSGYPAVVLNEYGRGAVVLFTFNPLDIVNRVDAVEIFGNALDYTAPEETEFYPYASVGVEILIRAQYADFDLKLLEQVPEELRITALTGDAEIDGNTIEWKRHLDRDGVAEFFYTVRLPNLPGEYRLSTDIYYLSDGIYRLYKEKDTAITIDRDMDTLTGGIITELGMLDPTGRDRHRLRKASRMLERVQNRVVRNHRDAERNIKDILKAIKGIKDVRYPDIDLIRRDMGILLRIWDIQWYLLSQKE